MAHFRGNLRLANVPESLVRADFQVVGDVIVVTSEDRTIGHWKLADIDATPHDDGLVLVVEGEELIFDTESEELILVLARNVPERGTAPVASELSTPPVELPNPAPPPSPVVRTPAPPPLGAPPRERRRAPKPLSQPRPTIPAPLPEPSTHEKPDNHSLGRPALGLGIAGMVLALLPNLAVVAMVAGALALGFGVFVLYDTRKEGNRPSTDAAAAGAALGVIAVVMGMIVVMS